MAIKTSTFLGWRLSDKDVDAFLKQVNGPGIGTPHVISSEARDLLQLVHN